MSSAGSNASSDDTSSKPTTSVLADQLAIAILVFSTLAFAVVSFQFVQSIFANAKGLPNCDERVLGKWATKSGPRFWHVWRYLRAEVEFESPIIFIALKSNQNGPLRPKQTKIYYADGQNQSDYRVDLDKEIIYDQPDPPPGQMPQSTSHSGVQPKTRSLRSIFRGQRSEDIARFDLAHSERDLGLPSDCDPALGPIGNRATNTALVAVPRRKPRERIATVAHERVTWLSLLIAIQRMERDSDIWDNLQWSNANLQQPVIDDNKKLAVGIQIMRRSFETNPSVKKPYATSAICHIVELAAMLGIFWKEFDRVNGRYRAEGNGYILTGHRIPDFGIVFTFEQNGGPSFGKCRTIHASEIKEFCFGNVPTIYRKKDDDLDWQIPFTGQQNLSHGIQTLQLGSRKEIAETLNMIGCNANTVYYYLAEEHRHIHLFPGVAYLAIPRTCLDLLLTNV